MEKYAESKGFDCKIWAVGSTEVHNHLDHADVLLLGPQVRFLLAQLKKEGEKKGIPVASINPQHYGLCNGEEVLKQAFNLLKGE
jgi:PTS system cellobiose-specific IIB component